MKQIDVIHYFTLRVAKAAKQQLRITNLTLTSKQYNIVLILYIRSFVKRGPLTLSALGETLNSPKLGL